MLATFYDFNKKKVNRSILLGASIHVARLGSQQIIWALIAIIRQILLTRMKMAFTRDATNLLRPASLR